MTFATEITLTGPSRAPAQMLAAQEYDGHASVHDAAEAAALGLAGAPIEGPTHFSQFDPLAVAVWGDAWFERGCISSHFRTMVVEGEEVVASLTTTGPGAARIEAHKADGTPVLTGTASVGPDHPPTELDGRLAGLGDPGDLFVVDRLEVGMRIDEGLVVSDGGRRGQRPELPLLPGREARAHHRAPPLVHAGWRRRPRRGAGPWCRSR